MISKVLNILSLEKEGLRIPIKLSFVDCVIDDADIFAEFIRNIFIALLKIVLIVFGFDFYESRGKVVDSLVYVLELLELKTVFFGVDLFVVELSNFIVALKL